MTIEGQVSIARGVVTPAQVDFYGTVFGWAFDDGIVSMQNDPIAEYGLPVHTGGWMTWLRVEDVGDAVAAVEQAGGSVVERPTDGGGPGLSVVRDRAGAVLGLRSGPNLPPPLSRVEGHFAWSQLNAHDPAEAASFYEALLGWRVEEAVNGRFSYQNFLEVDIPRAGLMKIDTLSGLSVPVLWQVYVSARDVDAVAARVVEAGGRIRVQPTSIIPGRFAVCADSDGDIFAVEHMTD